MFLRSPLHARPAPPCAGRKDLPVLEGAPSWKAYSIESSSTSKTSVELGGIAPG
jgi:hypothetical protein